MSRRRTIYERTREYSRKVCLTTVSPCSKEIEWRIIQSYVWVLRAPHDVDGLRMCSLARHGAFEVRLIEPSHMPRGDSVTFWIELYDHERRITLDSFGNDDLEEAAISTVDLISEAEKLNQLKRH